MRAPKLKLNAGDVVSRAFDGPRMTVESCKGDYVRCLWFGIDHNARWTGPHTRRFRHDQIMLVERRKTAKRKAL
jgi:uncharacterized protein YodC (DUF2158 family)